MSRDRHEEPGVLFCTPDGHLRSLRQIEADVICLAMSHHRGNVCRVARDLNIGRSTLYRKLEEFGIEVGASSLLAGSIS